MLPLRESCTLLDVQRYVREMERERGFTDCGLLQQCLQLGEEIGELFKAVRRHEKMRTGSTSIVGTVDEELADVLIYVCAIANRLDIDLESAFRRKEEVNESRSWI